MLNSEERELRKSQLGASEVSKIFNFDNKGAIDLWKLKIGLIESNDFSNQSMVVGNLTEEHCLQFFFKTMKVSDYTLNERIENKRVKGLVASTDGMFNGVPVENKTIKFENFIDLKVSKNYIIQLQTQMACLDAEYGYIVFNAIDEEDYNNPLAYEPSLIKQHSIKIKRDSDMISEIESRAKYFLWCVEFKHEPSETHYLTRTLL